ncbi:glycosyltransferase family 4 protein [Archangium lansingense]|uniref:glycosyltransferase family 4 protein n=1 Tax=Archangium lansingense TaxID=2995310 RepID=UPI003B76FC5F
MRIALMMGLAPRKLGSFEGWLKGFCEVARQRGHHVDVFGRAPIHPKFAQALQDLGCGWELLNRLEEKPWRAARMLASCYDVLHLNLLPPRGLVSRIAYAAWPARVLFMFRSDLPPPGPEPFGRPALRYVLDRFTLLRVAQIGAVSDFVLSKQRARFSFDPARSRTIYNGVDVERFQPRSHAPHQGFHILTVANLRPHKGVHHAIGALAYLRRPEVKLTLVGDGPEVPRLQELARRLGVASQVEYLGIRNDVHLLMNEADLFVHPSRAEGFGLTIAEAMASGRAVAAFRVGGIPELIEHGQSGLLVPPGDEQRLASAIDMLLSNPSYRRKLEQNAMQRVRERFDVRKTIGHHVDWCEEVLASPQGVAGRKPAMRAGAAGATAPAAEPERSEELPLRREEGGGV